MLKDKQQLTINNAIELGENISDEAKGKGRIFVSRFIEPGVAHYEEFGDVLITKETLDKFIHTMVGCPVIIKHKDIDDKNADEERVGVVSRVWFNELDGWYYCEGIIWDKQAIDLVKNQDWSVSCTYDFDSDNQEKTHNGKKIDREFTGGEFLHLALVPNPRYERANIVMNSVDNAKDWDDNEGDWITVNGNHLFIKKGQSKDEVVKSFIEKQGDKSSDKKEVKTEDKKETQEGYKYNKQDAIKAIELFSKSKYKDENRDKSIKKIKDKIEKGENLSSIDKYHLDYIMKETGYKDKMEYTGREPFELKKGDNVYLASQDGPNKRVGKITKQISDDVVEVEFPEKGNMPARTDRYYIDELKISNDKDNMTPTEKRLTREKYEEYQKNIESMKEPESEGQAKAREVARKIIKDTLNKTNNEGDITMTVLNELKDFIKSVVNNEKDKEMEEVKNEDKRKLIEEVGGILKGKVDDEIIRTIIKKMEEASYESSEKDKADNKCKNEDEEKEEKFEEEKEIANKKAKNEEKKEEDEKESENEDEEEKDKDDEVNKEEVKNKCKNSMDDIKKVVMGGNKKVESKYMSRADRFALGEKY